MRFNKTIPKNRLYNAGDRISEALNYSLPDGHDLHCVGRYTLDAPEKEFFTIPEAFPVKNGQGEDVLIYPRFTELILRADRFGQRGVVLIDPDYKEPEGEPNDNEPIAASDAEAIKKANRILEKYEKNAIQLYIDQCNAIRTSGGVPLAAAGYTKRLLKKYGVVDPSEAVLIKADDQTRTIQELQKAISDQQKVIDQLLAAKSAAPVQTAAKEGRARK